MAKLIKPHMPVLHHLKLSKITGELKPVVRVKWTKNDRRMLIIWRSASGIQWGIQNWLFVNQWRFHTLEETPKFIKPHILYLAGEA